MAKALTQADLDLLRQKVDYLTAIIEAQEARQREYDELKQDLIPIANHMIKLSIDELAEIGGDFELEDLLFLLKRLLRDSHLLQMLLEKLEAGLDLADEMTYIGNQVFSTSVEALDRLERKGYFAFAREGWYILDRIVAEFSQEDVRALGDNIVTILSTVRNLTQPEVLALANNAVSAIQPVEDGGQEISTLALLRELSDPKVRRGLARLLNLVKVLADQPSAGSPN